MIGSFIVAAAGSLKGKDLMPVVVSKVPVVVIITKVATRTIVTTITGIVSRNRSSSRRLARKM